MIDEIKNPWKQKKGTVVFDIETNWHDDWSERGKRNRKFLCGVVYSFDEDKYFLYKKPKGLIDRIKKSKCVVSYNGEGFDFLVLEKHGIKLRTHKNRWKPVGIKSFDIMHKISEIRPKKHRNKKYPSLEELIQEHYEKVKSKYDYNNPEELMEHCREDVMYTKQLYEEPIWKVPVLDRSSSKKRWKNRYDDDMSGFVWDGENFTYLVDFGSPIQTINVSDTITCPMCNKMELSLFNVARMKTSKLTCPLCESVITLRGQTSAILSAQTKEEYEKSVCPNCNKRLEEESQDHYGWGAGPGTTSSGRSLCPACGKGCYYWEDEDTPGFREHYKGPCCKCRKDIGEWMVENR